MSAMKPPIYYRKSTCEVTLDIQTFRDHKGMAERLKKTLYYGKQPKTDRPSLPMTEFAVEIFSKAVPGGLGQIDMDYASGISRNACISPCSMILAMAYIERIRSRSPEYLTKVSSSDLFLISMMVASKFLYDEGEDEEVFNDEWAKSANMDRKEINQLERSFLSALDWNAYMNADAFEELLSDVEYKIAMRKSKDRGWCTYTDLCLLLNNFNAAQHWNVILESFIKVVTVGSIAYLASAATMIGAVVLAQQLKLHASKLVVGAPKTNDFTRLPAIDGTSHWNEPSLNSYTNVSHICDQSILCEYDVMDECEDPWNLNTSLTSHHSGFPAYFLSPNCRLVSELFSSCDNTLRNGCLSFVDDEPLQSEDVSKVNSVNGSDPSKTTRRDSDSCDTKDISDKIISNSKLKSPTVRVAANLAFI